jgi:acyl carrier protein
VLEALARVAPEVDPRALDPARPVREQVDIDSIDFLNFLVEIHRVLGVDVPEKDYGQCETVNDTVAYLAPRATPAGRSQASTP